MVRHSTWTRHPPCNPFIILGEIQKGPVLEEVKSRRQVPLNEQARKCMLCGCADCNPLTLVSGCVSPTAVACGLCGHTCRASPTKGAAFPFWYIQADQHATLLSRFNEVGAAIADMATIGTTPPPPPQTCLPLYARELMMDTTDCLHCYHLSFTRDLHP